MDGRTGKGREAKPIPAGSLAPLQKVGTPRGQPVPGSSALSPEVAEQRSQVLKCVSRLDA